MDDGHCSRSQALLRAASACGPSHMSIHYRKTHKNRVEQRGSHGKYHLG
jgi:hypothetical protein